MSLSPLTCDISTFQRWKIKYQSALNMTVLFCSVSRGTVTVTVQVFPKTKHSNLKVTVKTELHLCHLSTYSTSWAEHQLCTELDQIKFLERHQNFDANQRQFIQIVFRVLKNAFFKLPIIKTPLWKHILGLLVLNIKIREQWDDLL